MEAHAGLAGRGAGSPAPSRPTRPASATADPAVCSGPEGGEYGLLTTGGAPPACPERNRDESERRHDRLSALRHAPTDGDINGAAAGCTAPTPGSCAAGPYRSGGSTSWLQRGLVSPPRTPGGRLERVRIVLDLASDLSIAKFHDADGGHGAPVIKYDVFGGPEVSASERTLHVKTSLGGILVARLVEVRCD